MDLDPTFVQRQLDAAYGALTAAQVALEGLARELNREGLPENPEGGACAHRSQQPAATMGGEVRAYCADCRSFLYPDGRVEAA